MSDSTESVTSTTETLTSSEKNNFTKQLLHLQQQQEEQYFRLTQQYKEQQDMLQQQQQQELKQYYKRQMILNANHKISLPEELAPSGVYRGYHSETITSRKQDAVADNHENISMLEEPQSAPTSSSNALSALVRDRVRKKVLDNISKKLAFERMDAGSFTVKRQDDFNRWAYESGAYDDDENNLIPLRKAASEPNLKGRNQYKHRVRYKPCVEHPLMAMPEHPRHSCSPGDSRHPDISSERREAISPPYNKSVEGKVFPQGPRGIPLFQSPSLPNINLGSGLSQVHFPPIGSLSNYSSGSNPDFKAPLQPGHPKYLDMLKTQYSTNHRFLEHVMRQHGHDPKEIDLFHQRYLLIPESHTLSDEDRVKQLLESQNKLYIHLVNLFSLPSSGMSKSFSKLSDTEAPPPFSLGQSRSQDSLRDIKSIPPPPTTDPYYKDVGAIPHPAMSMQSRFRFSNTTGGAFGVPNDLHMKDHQAARFRLKEHLRERQDAIKDVTLDAHFRRLERDHKIQEESEEDVHDEQHKPSPPNSHKDRFPYRRPTELLASSSGTEPTSAHSSDTRINGSAVHINGGTKPKLYNSNHLIHNSDTNSRLHNSENSHLHTSENSHIHNSENSRLHDGDPRAYGGESKSLYPEIRLHGSDPRLRGSNPRLHGSDPRLHLHGSDPRLHGSDPRLHDTEGRLRGSDPRLHASDPRIHENRLYTSGSSLHGSGSRLHGSDPHLHAPSTRLSGSDTRLHGSDSHLHGSNSRLHGSDSRMQGSLLQLKGSDPRIENTPEADSSVARCTKSMTGLVYDTIMLKHQCTCGERYPVHPESSGRLQSIWARLQETGVANMCERIKPRKATLAELQTVHSEQHAILFGGGSNSSRGDLRCFSKLPCGGVGVDADTVWNETHTSNAARMAAGCVIELAFKVASGELKNGFAIIRPPGHHAEAHQAMGFCYFNSIAIAAKLLCMKMAVERVMIVDWDIHHGNGTERMFYDDDRVIYISMHRHDDGNFFPGTGKAEMCGAGIGVGCNINIPFNGGLEPKYGDVEYLAAFRTIVIPIVKEYKPDIILVSAGFDAADGHSPQLGGYCVSPACFAYMTKRLMDFANGKLVLALEGGYVLQALCDSAENCIRALLGGACAELSDDVKQGTPHESAVKCIENAAEIQGKYWPGIKRAASQIASSLTGAQKIEEEEADTVTALASLSMHVVQNRGGGIEKTETPIETEEPMEEN